MGAAEERVLDIPRLNWKQDRPVWVDQWPLPQEKLRALEILVEGQLTKGHIVPSNSPWNTPVFVIKKPGKDKWRLLQDLRKVNDVIGRPWASTTRHALPSDVAQELALGGH